MGTDISMYVEQRMGDEWYYVGEMKENMYYGLPGEPQYYPESIYDIRDYNLFAILANYRNDQEVPFEPIAPLRGLPEDLSAELRLWYDHYNIDEDQIHASWLTLKELACFDWHGKSKKMYARVDERVKHLFHPDRGYPAWNDWPKGIQNGYTPMDKNDPYCNVSWTTTYAEAVAPFLTEILDGLVEVYGPTSDVRLVFNFSY